MVSQGADFAVDDREARATPSQGEGIGGKAQTGKQNARKGGEGEGKITLPDGTLWEGLRSWEGLGEGLSGVSGEEWGGGGQGPERAP